MIFKKKKVLHDISKHFQSYFTILEMSFFTHACKLHNKLESEKQIKVDRNDDSKYVMKRKYI